MSSDIRAQKHVMIDMITSLPDDVMIDILARLSRCDYATLSLVSKHFRSLVSSPELYTKRSSLGYTKACIYAWIFKRDTQEYCLYNLHRKANNNQLVRIESIPPLTPSDGSFVVSGSKIYVLGGINDHNMTSRVLCIECRSHKVQVLPSLPRPMSCTAVVIIDGKIYVIGCTNDDFGEKKVIMVFFNIETQMWELGMTKVDMKLCPMSHGCVGLLGKMYFRDSHNSFVYTPKENNWEIDEMLNSKEWGNACVIDDVLYYFDYREKKLRAYDTKHKCWRVVKGVKRFLPKGTSLRWSHTVSYDGKLALLLSIKEEDPERIKDIWFVEIAIERDQGGKIRGKVECCDVVSYGGNLLLLKSRVVMV